MRRQHFHSQRGMTLMVVCLLLIAFLGIAALCVDLGVLYTARTSAQHAADAAALAGAFTFVNSPTATQPAAAQQEAIAVASTNKILGQSVTIGNGDVVVDTANRQVTVTVTRTGAGGVNTFFAKALGISQVTIQAQARAQASKSASGARCIKPVYMPNTIFSALDPATACTQGQVIFSSTGTLSPWVQDASGQFRFAGQCTLIRPTTPSGALTPSQFYSLDFGSGAATYSAVWSSCLNQVSGASPQVVQCGDSIPVETGDMVGPTRQGVNNMVGSPADTWLGPDPTTGIFQYQTSTGVSDTSKSLGLFAVWDSCSNPITSGTHGQVTPVIGFVEMFVDGMSNTCSGSANGGNWVRVHAVSANGCSGGNGNGSTGPFALPVQLVKH
jgi:hypothetical protein